MASNARRNNDQSLVEELRLNEMEDSNELEIDLVALMYRLLEKAKWIVAAALLGTILAGVVTANFVTPMYESTSKLYVVNSSNATIDLAALQIGDKLAADYVQVFNNWEVHDKVIEALNLDYTYGEIQDMLSISTPSNTRIIEITVTSSSPQEARDIAMAYAEVACAFIVARMETESPSIFENPRVPLLPSSPSMLRNLIIGFMLGAVVAAAIVVIQFIVDDRVRNADTLQKQLGLPTLGMMPIQEGERAKGKNNARKNTSGKVDSKA